MPSSSRRNFLKVGLGGAAAGLAAACAAPAPAQPALTAPTSSAPSSVVDVAPTAVSAAPAPATASTAPAAAPKITTDRRTLVVVQLSGGHDGLNAVVPYGNGLYYQLRPQIGIPADQVLHLDDQIGLHPNLKSFKTLYDNKQLAIIQGVGYPNA